MDKRRLGRTDLQVSALGFGAAEIGLTHLAFAQAETLLGRVIDAGINVIDTAECYNESEELIGSILHRRRSDCLLFTKCGHADDPSEHWTEATIRNGLERSLRRLRTDHVDLVQLHSCPFDILRRGDVISLLEDLKKEGKTRFIGASADGGAAEYAINTGRFDVLQTSFSIADQEFLDRNAPLVAKQDMGVIVKRPIANAVWKHAERPADPWLHAYWDRLQALDYPFLHDANGRAAETAVRFAMTPLEVCTVIVGTVHPHHLERNAASARLGPLSADMFDSIRLRWKTCGGETWSGKG